MPVTTPLVPLRPRLRISVPFSFEVEYFTERQMAISITNSSQARLLVESLTLRFQADEGLSAIPAEQRCDWELSAHQVKDQVVTIAPTPLYLANTNALDVMVKYRVFRKTTLGKQLTEIRPGFFVIIKNSTIKLGQAFISFKEKEDLGLASILERFASRAGFRPYIAAREARPGTPLWNRIESEISKSVVAFVVWTKNTAWGTGVQQEIEICSKCHVPYVLLIERNIELPEDYDESIEYQRFDPKDPTSAFSDAVVARRHIILDSKADE